MQILNLINKEKSNIDYTITRFPDGEVQITLDGIDHKDSTSIVCRITNPEELFILEQAADILRRHGVVFDISILYLMSMRMDRVMDFTRPFSLSIVLDILDNLGASRIGILTPHSKACFSHWKHTVVYELHLPEDLRIECSSEDQLLFPDAGAKKRYSYLQEYKPITCSKVRDITTGKIQGIKIDNPENITGKPILVLDDLCDGGRTFVEVAKAVKALHLDIKLNISVTHMVNPKGIENLSKNFDHVWFTNSYKTWDNLPDNVTQIDVTGVFPR